MLKLDPVALTDVGRRRNHNEDYLGDLIFRSVRKYGPEKSDVYGYLFAVADGMGGHASGEVASEMAVNTLFERYYNGPSSGDIGTDLLNAVKEANLQVHHAGISNGRGQMGTTLTLALVKGNRAIIGNVGDSRTYLVRQGLIERITHDHSLVQDQIDMGALTPEQAERSMIRNVITRAIGHREDVEPDFFERELKVNDVLLLCSDGLHGLVHEDELGTIVASSSSLKEAAKTLIDLANERGGVDNISVMLIGITELDDPIPPILNERAAHYPPPPAHQPTTSLVEPITDRLKNKRQNSGEQSTNTAMLDPSNAPTIPNPAPSVREQTTKKFQPNLNSELTKKKGNSSLIIIGLVLLLLVGGVIAVVVLGNNTAQVSVGTVALSPTNTPQLTSEAAALVPTVTPAATSTTNITTPSINIELTEIKRFQVALQNFPAESYNIIMMASNNNSSADIIFKPTDSKTFESDVVTLGTGSYKITIKSAGNTPTPVQDIVTLNLKETEASSSETRVSLSNSPSSILKITISSKS